MSVIVASKFDCNAGNATLTMVPSIKARIEPRIVATKIHGRAAGEHGADAGAERITAASHGCAGEADNLTRSRSRLFMAVSCARGGRQFARRPRPNRHQTGSPAGQCRSPA